MLNEQAAFRSEVMGKLDLVFDAKEEKKNINGFPKVKIILKLLKKSIM